MQKNHTCKILAVGIIVLFIGVGIHPAFAVEDKASIVNNENIDDFNCEECNEDRPLCIWLASKAFECLFVMENYWNMAYKYWEDGRILLSFICSSISYVYYGIVLVFQTIFLGLGCVPLYTRAS